MELVDGPSLAERLTRGPLSVPQVLEVIAQTAAGLHAAHTSGLVHRDVKPANLLLSPAGTLKITDFGIAHALGSVPITGAGMIIGTSGYLAPERAAGGRATPASDIYALGIVGYECLAGAPPFGGGPMEQALAHQQRPLPPLPAGVPADLAAFIAQLTAKDPALRPRSATEVVSHARLLRDGVSGALPPPPARPSQPTLPQPHLPPPRPLPAARGAPWGRAVIAGACLMLVLAGVIVARTVLSALTRPALTRPAVASPTPAASPPPATLNPGGTALLPSRHSRHPRPAAELPRARHATQRGHRHGRLPVHAHDQSPVHQDGPLLGHKHSRLAGGRAHEDAGSNRQ
jgi:serine/threonine-protein kinase